MNKEVLWPSISKGGPGSGRYPAGSGEGESSKTSKTPKGNKAAAIETLRLMDYGKHGRVFLDTASTDKHFIIQSTISVDSRTPARKSDIENELKSKFPNVKISFEDKWTAENIAYR